jgi:chemotaxis protein MotC
LLEAAQRIGEEIVKPVAAPVASDEANAGGDADAGGKMPVAKVALPAPSGAKAPANPAAAPQDAVVDDFVTQGRNKLGEIDSLLAKEGGKK